MKDELKGIWKEVALTQPMYYPGICLEGLRKIKRNPNQNRCTTFEPRNFQLQAQSFKATPVNSDRRDIEVTWKFVITGAFGLLSNKWICFRPQMEWKAPTLLGLTFYPEDSTKYVPPSSSPDEGNRSSLQNLVFFTILGDRRSQNPLECTYMDIVL